MSTSAALVQRAETHNMSAMGVDQRAECIRLTAACVAACGKASEHCTKLAKEGKGEHAGMAALCADCGDCCASYLTLVSRNSKLAPVMAEACAKCCDLCAAECDTMDSPEMKACAEACRACAAACRAMAK